MRRLQRQVERALLNTVECGIGVCVKIVLRNGIGGSGGAARKDACGGTEGTCQ